MTTEQLGIWIAAIATLSMYSVLFKDNTFFEVGQVVFVAFAAGHTVVMALMNVQTTAITPLMKGDATWLIPLALGCLLFSRFTRKHSYLSRCPLGFLMGVGAAVTIKGQLDGALVKQLQSTMLPLTSLDNIITVFGVIGTITYFFFFTGSRKGILKHSATIGRWVMMIAFGSSFGNTVMARMSLLAARLQFLFGSWIPLIPKR